MVAKQLNPQVFGALPNFSTPVDLGKKDLEISSFHFGPEVKTVLQDVFFYNFGNFSPRSLQPEKYSTASSLAKAAEPGCSNVVIYLQYAHIFFKLRNMESALEVCTVPCY